MTPVLFVLLWVGTAWWADRRLLKHWHDEFGDYVGFPWESIVIGSLAGPVWLFLSVFMAPPKAVKGRASSAGVAHAVFRLPKPGK